MNYDDARALIASGTPCSVCGKPATDAHHLQHKGMGGRGVKAEGDPDDATPLCRTCHTDHHDQGTLRLRRNPSGALLFMARGKTASRLHVRDGSWHAAREGVDPDAVDELPPDDDLAEIEAQIAEAYAALTKAAGSSWRDIAEAVIEHERLCIERLGKREGRTRARRWREEAAIADATASNMRTVVRHVPRDKCREASQAVQVELAKAIKQKRAPIDDLIASAEVLTKSAFVALYWPKPEPVPTPRVDCPLGLSCAHPKEEA